MITYFTEFSAAKDVRQRIVATIIIEPQSKIRPSPMLHLLLNIKYVFSLSCVLKT